MEPRYFQPELHPYIERVCVVCQDFSNIGFAICVHIPDPLHMSFAIAWASCMAFSHAAVEHVSGGWSRLMKEFILAIHKQLDNGFALQCRDQPPFMIFLQISAIIGDFDALRCCYDWRGAASIKLCMCCKNIVSRSSELALFGENLFDQTHAGLEGCQFWTDEEIANLFDNAKLEPLPTKKEREATCKAAGFNLFNFLGRLSHNVSRTVLPVSSCIFDVMHLYWSNGLCSWEICQFASNMGSHCPCSQTRLRRLHGIAMVPRQANIGIALCWRRKGLHQTATRGVPLT